MPRQAQAGQRAGQKKPLTEAQKAALAKGQAARKRNIAARHASRARQTASSQVASLPALARGALSPASQPAEQDEASVSSTASSASSSPSKKLSPEEQDALIFSFAENEDDEQAAAAATSDPAKKSLGDRVANFLSADAPKSKTDGVTDAEERDAQQAAAQWTDLGAVLLIFLAGIVFAEDLAPNEEQAKAMSAPLCRILMRHIKPLREASADAYDIAAFAGAALVYWWTIKPELARRRAERKVVHESAQQARPAVVAADVARAEGNISQFAGTRGSGQYPQTTVENRDRDVRSAEQKPAGGDAGEGIAFDALGIKL